MKAEPSEDGGYQVTFGPDEETLCIVARDLNISRESLTHSDVEVWAAEAISDRLIRLSEEEGRFADDDEAVEGGAKVIDYQDFIVAAGELQACDTWTAGEPCSPGCPGWLVSGVDRDPGEEIEKCDECGRFTDDDEAVAHMVTLLPGFNSEAEEDT